MQLIVLTAGSQLGERIVVTDPPDYASYTPSYTSYHRSHSLRGIHSFIHFLSQSPQITRHILLHTLLVTDPPDYASFTSGLIRIRALIDLVFLGEE